MGVVPKYITKITMEQLFNYLQILRIFHQNIYSFLSAPDLWTDKELHSHKILTDMCIDSSLAIMITHLFWGVKKESSHEVDRFCLFGYAESERINIVTVH